jgi:2-keto-4-pentenoate hydratase/2-oxohepta-3-ene-1,7-dioic acid hydratase in catechol pathway
MVICTTSKLENCISLRTAGAIRTLPAAPLGGSHSHVSLRDAADVIGSGTISGPTVSEAGALIELALNGAAPVELATGEKRSFLEDGDTAALRGYCEKPGFARIGFGECRGEVLTISGV